MLPGSFTHARKRLYAEEIAELLDAAAEISAQVRTQFSRLPGAWHRLGAPYWNAFRRAHEELEQEARACYASAGPVPRARYVLRAYAAFETLCLRADALIEHDNACAGESRSARLHQKTYDADEFSAQSGAVEQLAREALGFVPESVAARCARLSTLRERARHDRRARAECTLLLSQLAAALEYALARPPAHLHNYGRQSAHQMIH